MTENAHALRHVALIMDGNGRWAQQRGLPRTLGHREGIKRLREVVKAAADAGLEAVTFYAFSSENWSRPKSEVRALMSFFRSFIDKEVSQMHAKNIRFRVIGREDPLPLDIVRKIRAGEKKTAANTGLTVVLAVNYGSRQEIVDACKRVAADVREGTRALDTVDEEVFSGYLSTAGLPDPDLLIRTSGEQRISNYLLWQLSYAELYFSPVCWPDFGREEFSRAMDEFNRRQRRFGGVTAKAEKQQGGKAC